MKTKINIPLIYLLISGFVLVANGFFFLYYPYGGDYLSSVGSEWLSYEGPLSTWFLFLLGLILSFLFRKSSYKKFLTIGLLLNLIGIMILSIIVELA